MTEIDTENTPISKAASTPLWLVFAAALAMVWLLSPALTGPWLNIDAKDFRFVFYWSLLVAAFLIAALGSVKRLLYVLAPFAIWVPIELGYQQIFRVPTDESTFAFMYESNFAEALDFLGWGKMLGLALLVIGGPLLIIWIARKLPQVALLRPMLRVVVMAGVCLMVYVELYGRRSYFTDETPVMGAVVGGRLPPAILVMQKSFPVGLPIRYAKYLIARNEVVRLARPLRDWQFAEIPAQQPADSELNVVLFIGESSRKRSWSLFGYDRATNPLLAKRKDLILLTDLTASSHATRLSVPVITNRKDPKDLGLFLKEGSILRAYKNASFATSWISNQQVVGEFDSPISVIAYQADERVFLNPSVYDFPGRLDDELARQLQERVVNAGARLVVLHGLGSHTAYNFRYPASFERFKPVIKRRGAVLEMTENIIELVNTYDNTILYTDYVLDETIKTLERSNKPSVLLFVSDHGEGMPSTQCGSAGHLYAAADTVEVPAFIWVSPAYAAKFPEKIIAMKANAHKRLSTALIFETLVELGDIKQNGLKRYEGIASPDFQEQPRWASDYKFESRDWDNDRTLDPCGVFVPRNEVGKTQPWHMTK